MGNVKRNRRIEQAELFSKRENQKQPAFAGDVFVDVLRLVGVDQKHDHERRSTLVSPRAYLPCTRVDRACSRCVAVGASTQGLAGC